MYKLMLVEDEETIRQGLRHLVREVTAEFEVQWEASHGREALQLLDTIVPDALLADIRMRHMDGLALAAKVKERYPDMPVVLISGHSEFEYAQAALRTGVLDYVLKPVQRTALTRALERIKSVLMRAEDAPTNSGGRPGEEEPGLDRHQLIRKVKAYIRSHPDGDLRLQNLAELVHLNPTYLSQLFKSVTGANVTDYVTEVRMEKARQLLGKTQLKVYDIARLTGYQSPKHFMLVFKEHTGCTPSDYRAKAGPGG